MRSTDILKTEQAITQVKETFEKELAKQLQLIKVSSPIAVLDGTGINDDLNGIERAVSFPVKSLNDQKAVVVHSLAKWKRLRLHQLGIEAGTGILTDMRALRPDEDYTHLHSIYVDQWDWEKHIEAKDRSIYFLKETVKKIYEALKVTETSTARIHPGISPVLPEAITFIHAEELLKRYPLLTPKQRENAITKEFGAVFIIGIGGKLSDGKEHDGRAPDYDDWSTISEEGAAGLNGDLVVWHPILESAFELSSMGIRVDKKALLHQLEVRDCKEREGLMFHQKLLSGELPESIGGGIGQSRVCMFMLKKAHIGEVQVSIWPEKELEKLEADSIYLL